MVFEIHHPKAVQIPNTWGNESLESIVYLRILKTKSKDGRVIEQRRSRTKPNKRDRKARDAKLTIQMPNRKDNEQ